jgi:5-methylcytosine-specific restriction endonuclease McrA
MARPRILTDEQRREKRRLKSAAWRAANRERAREITRESMKRAAAAKAVSAGRPVGKVGAMPKYTEEQKRALRNERAKRYYYANLEKCRDAARLRGQAKRDGTFVSRARKRLTAEERRIVEVTMAANRRTRKRRNGGTHSKDDIIRLMAEQEGKCAMCSLPFGDDGYHVDHFVPLALGGLNDASNLKLLHPLCNLKKGARHPSELGLSPITVVG